MLSAGSPGDTAANVSALRDLYCSSVDQLGNTSGSHNCTMSFETQMHLLLLSELVSALRANDSDTFRRWLSGGIQDLGRPAVEELMLEWMNPLLTVEEMDRLVGWHLGVSI